MAFTGFYFIFIAALLPRVFLALPLNSLNTDLYGVGIDGIPQQYAATVDQNDAITDHAIVHPWYLDRQPPDGGDANKAVEYMFSAFDEEFHLILEPAYDFFTDSLVIQYSWANTSLLLPPTQYCYYQGVSNNHNGSKAYANTCAGGLSALVVTEDAHYFVQPIDDENSLKYEADDENSLKYEADDENSLKYEADGGEPPAHVMHKRSASQLVCGVEDETTGHHSRGKRYANTVTQKTKHLEVVIVADEILRRQHGADTEYYILSTFNQVYALFKDSTLGVDLKLNVKRIRILEEAQEDLLLDENVQTSLQRFCAWEWQRRLDTDISILITGRNMGFGNQYDVTGNAMGIGSACNPDKRCVIAEDHGPSGLVFTLAHEIAHTLGIYHDGELSRCANDGYIMSPTNSGGKRAFQWSRCSRNDIFNWLESPGASCLDNVPPSTPGYFLSRVPLPGHYYDADYQCSAIWHDAGATVAEPVKNSKDICEELYCDYATFNMVSNHIPPLDGTSCGIHRACIRGWCMNLYSTRDCGEQACPATFYESEWETCNPNAEQNPCIQSRLVQCGELHNDGSFVALEISDCIAGGEELPVSQRCCCTTGSCTVASPTTERYQWLASDFSSSCTPNCGVNSVHTRIVSCYDSVLNVPTDVEVLCDSSSKPSDTTPCTTCYLWEASAFGSCSATCGTNVIQTRTVTCKDGISGQVLSDSLCDAASKPSDVQLCTNLPACPTTSRYAWIIGGFGECSVSCGGGSRSRSVACFDNQVQGVVLDDLCITNVGVKPQTEFEACNQQSCEIQAYQYEYGTWGICSQTCGTGIQARSITCKRIADSVVVPESNCVDQGLIRDSATQTCNMGDCPGTTFYEYYTTQWGTCSLTCGGGTQSRTIYCAVAGTNGQSSAAESNCLQQGLVKPSDAQFCNTQSCTTSTYEYRSLNWQPCTVTCGGGTQTRFAYCAFVGTTNGVPESFCEDQGLTKPSETQSCNTEACSTNTYEYFTTSFGSCTVSCGGGTQSRTVYCAVAGTNGAMGAQEISCETQGLTKPTNVQSCNTQACQTTVYEFYTGDFGSCSLSCNGGVQTRTVYCAVAGTNGGTGAQESSCLNQGLTKPSDIQSCNTQPCQTFTYEYFAGNWGVCTATCGVGTQSRDVFCIRIPENSIVDNSFCVNAVAPPSEQICPNLPTCETTLFEYFTGDYGTCSVSCGGGSQTRIVYCRAVGTTTEVGDALCTQQGLNKPSTSQSCGLGTCPNYQFITGSWNDCPVTCGSGTQTRTVNCINLTTNELVDNSVCLNLGMTLPENTQSCPDLPSCSSYEFVTGQWDACPVTCGSGTQTRTVNCINLTTNELFDNSVCLNLGMTLPENTQSCPDLPSCSSYEFVTDQWDACTVSCGGGGSQTRSVYCRIVGTTTQVEDSLCTQQGLNKPPTSQSCGLGTCPNYQFIPGTWNNCPVTCGSGTQTRTVNCINLTTNELVDNSVCLNLGMTLPENTQSCPDLPSCSSYEFVTDEWDACPVTCGSGIQTRTVSCYDTVSNGIVADSMCTDLGQTKPATQQACSGLNPCPTYVYQSGNWAGCSASCGGGTQTRTVTCIDSTSGTAVIESFCAGQTKPSTVGSCNTQACDGSTVYVYYYITGVWGPCDCATDSQDRAVQCVQVELPSYAATAATDDDCNAEGQVKPSATQSCTPTLCEAEWTTTPWGPCSVTCGIGTHSRYVYCALASSGDIVSTAECSEIPPATYELCDTEVDCGLYRWSVSQWSECSTTCGNGQQTRETRCFSVNGKIEEVLESLCIAGDRPETVQSCNLGRCDGLWTAAPWSSCSVSCDCGLQTRDVACRLTKEDDEILEEESCVASAKPTEERGCNTGPCPLTFDCGDTYTTETGVLSSPNYPANYPRDIECDKTVDYTLKTDGFHIEIDFLDFQLEGNTTDGDCLYDYVEVYDIEYNVSERYCGEFEELPMKKVYQGNSVRVRFVSDVSVENKGFLANWNYVSDDQPFYEASEWSECSVNCGTGEETRDITCMQGDDIVADSECNGLDRPESTRECTGAVANCPPPTDVCGDVLDSSGLDVYSRGYPANYINGDNCITTIINSGGCVKITFNYLHVQESPECQHDYIEIQDLNFGTLTKRYCGNLDNNLVWQSGSGMVRVTFHSDNTVDGKGFTATADFVPCIDYAWMTAPWEKCSKPCGSGVMTRPVTCVDINNNQPTSSEVFCQTLDKPDTMQACNTHPCTDCSDNIVESKQYISSPNYPEAYNNKDQCIINIVNPDQDACVRLIFLAFDVQDGSTFGVCDRDSLMIEDSGNSALSSEFCGNRLPPPWVSSTANVVVTFSTDPEVTRTGYEIYVRFEDCPQFIWQSSEWSDCDAECGGGTKVRDVVCISTGNSQEVPDNECVGLRPMESEPCNEHQCPPSDCDTSISESGAYIQSFGYPDNNYLANQDCIARITNDVGCIRIAFLDFALEAGSTSDLCNNDYLEVIDGNRPNDTDKYCGDESIPAPWESQSGSVTVKFHSNEANTERGYWLYVTFKQCRTFMWNTAGWSDCDVSCGGGQMSRVVTCTQSGVVVSDDLCNAPKPMEIESCQEQDCPVSDCDRDVRVSGELIQSPNYPQNYDQSKDCLITIENPTGGCVQLNFFDFALESGSQEGICDKDYLEVSVTGNPALTRRYCGDGFLPPTLISTGPTITLRFHSDEDSVHAGFSIYESFVQCPLYAYFATDWNECSVSCGDGERNRIVTCQRLSDNEVVNDLFCAGTKPSQLETCTRPSCSGCDSSVTSPYQSIGISNYDNNQDCEITITNVDGCIALIFLSMSVEAGMPNVCENDYLEIDDLGATLPPRKFCGNELPHEWFSVSGNVVLRFHSNDAITDEGFSVFVQFVDCPTYVWNVADWSDCDADCGGGTRSRSVTCQNSQTQYNVSDTECPLPKPSELEECNIDPCPGCDEVVTSEKIVSSPGYLAGLNYDNNIDCTVTALAPTGQCVRLTFLNLQIQPGSMQGVCDFDYLMITDMGNSALTDTMCGSESRTFSSVTGQVEILLHSDGSITNQGYHLYVTFIECPLYTFVPGDWQECNVECGGGMRTRLVQCQRISDGIEMPVSFCSGPQPAASEPCNTQPCPGCDASFTVGNQFIQSTNYPLSYPPNQDCVYTVSNTQGCISLQFLDFNLEAHPTCDNDYLMIQDLGDSALDRKLCGGNLPQIWTSTSGNDVAITFHSNDNIQDKGFYIYETFVPCPLYAWSLGAWSDCSLDCGGGSRTRTVECQLISSGAVVMDNLCTGPKPSESEDCNTQPCPDCDESFTAGYQLIQSTNYPLSYPPNQDCVYTVSNTQGCISLQFLDFNLEAHPTCDNDYLMIQDLGDSALDRKLCGGNLPQIWTSTSGNDVAVTFHSNDNIQDKGFYIYETFVPCPLYAWSLGAWSDCSLDCGGGSRTRTVECQLISSGAVVMDNLCTGPKPSESEDCNTQPCPGCDEVVLVGSQTIGSPNYGIGNYPPNQDCIYTITNNQACVRLLFLNFDLESGTTVDVCDRDYLRIEDLDYPELVETYCGDTTPPNWMSASGNVKLTFHSNNNNEHAGFSVFETFIACPVFDWVAGAWGDCDVTCGTGMRRRTVECLDVQSNEPAVIDSLCLNSRPDDAEICTEAPCAVDCDVSVTSSSTISSYNYPDDYVNNLDCVTTIYNADGCINFLFLNFDLESGTVNDVCDTDYVKIEDVSGGEEQFFCGTYSPLPSWQSSTGNVRLTLHTNDALTAGGYQIFAVFGDCPSYTWTTEAWSQCTADCGGGTQSRVVSCIDVVTQVVVQESSCTDAKPATSQVCNTQPCIQYCGRVITDSSTAELTSPNYDGVSLYDNNEDCMNTILSLQSQCIRIMFVSMDIQLGSTSSVCDNDYLELSDNSNPALTTRYCGTSLPPDWISTGSTVAVKFVTNSNNVARGYKINYQFVSCSVPQWVTGSWLTCSVSCGSGTQSRTVSCQNDAGATLPDSQCDAGSKPISVQVCIEDPCSTGRYQWQTAVILPCTATCGGGTEFYSVTCLDTQTGLTATSEALCTGTKPANSLTCNTDPCGGTTGCGVTVPSTVSSGVIMSPGYPANYANNLDCVTTFQLPQGKRIKFTINEFQLESDTSFRCEKDYLQFESSPSGNTALYCKQYFLPLIWESSAGDNEVTVRFYSDAVNTEQGYSADWEHI